MALEKQQQQAKLKSTSVGYLLWFLFGFHYAYLGKWGVQLLYWVTFGGFGLWTLIDLFRMNSMVNAYNAKLRGVSPDQLAKISNSVDELLQALKEERKLGESNPDAEKYCIVVDTETTGLQKDRTLRATKANLDNFPRIVEIAWGVFSRKGEIISEGNYLIKQESPIPAEATKVHGITDADCEKEGHNLEDVLHELSAAAAGCKRIVGHNVMFDKKNIEAEYIRTGIPKPFVGMTNYDTLQMGRQHFRIGRYPKLAELYEMVTGKDASVEYNLHRAVDDVSITAHIFFSLKWDGDTFHSNREQVAY